MNAIESRYPKELLACRSILLLADELYQRNEAKAVLDNARCATMAAVGLYAKARKQADAIYLVALQGYGEDALILARSLVNLCIDLKYITADSDQTEARAMRWTAKGRVERRKFAKRVGTTPPDEDKINWTIKEALAKEWPQLIEKRAKDAGLEKLYNLPYRHGSSFEHSDSWSATSFLDLKTGFVDMRTGPSDRFVDLALLTLACAFAEIACCLGRFYDFDFGGAEHEMEKHITTAFPHEETPL